MLPILIITSSFYQKPYSPQRVSFFASYFTKTPLAESCIFLLTWFSLPLVPSPCKNLLLGNSSFFLLVLPNLSISLLMCFFLLQHRSPLKSLLKIIRLIQKSHSSEDHYVPHHLSLLYLIPRVLTHSLVSLTVLFWAENAFFPLLHF